MPTAELSSQPAWLWRLSRTIGAERDSDWPLRCLLDGGYFGFDRGDCLHGQLWWLREYDVDLGSPLQACETDRYGPGLFSRQFAHGLVIVNPSENDVPVTVAADLLDLTTGTSGTCFVVPAQDARFLVGP